MRNIVNKLDLRVVFAKKKLFINSANPKRAQGGLPALLTVQGSSLMMISRCFMSEVIKDVSDTSFWVAHYRALESARPDALFNDPYAKILVGGKSAQIEALRSDATRWTQWTVIMRTVIIDQMIQDLIRDGVTCFVNIGAGLDSRPYRLNLGENITWIEMDFPHIIEYKNKILKDETPRCQLKRISLDLADRKTRQESFENLRRQHPHIAVLTEGVLPYLTPPQVDELSQDLKEHLRNRYWIFEYISPKSYRFLQNAKRMKALKNAPFQFFPEDWLGFFKTRGWKLRQERYFNETSEKHGRATPLPGFFKVLEFFLGKSWALPFKRMSGYLLWENAD